MKKSTIGAALAAAFLAVSPVSAQSSKAGLGTGPVTTPSEHSAQKAWWEKRAARRTQVAAIMPARMAAKGVAVRNPCACCDKHAMPGTTEKPL